MLKTAICAAGPIAELNKEICEGKTIRIKDKFPSLRTRKRIIQNWWNNLSPDDKLEVGSAAIHFNMMTANFPWKCGYQEHIPSDFDDLSRNQKRIVKLVFSNRDEVYHPFDLRYILKN